MAFDLMYIWRKLWRQNIIPEYKLISTDRPVVLATHIDASEKELSIIECADMLDKDHGVAFIS